MDQITTKLLRRLLRTLERLEHQQIEAVSEKEQAQGKTHDTQQIEIRLPPEVTSYYESEQHERPTKNKLETGIRLIQFAGFIAAAVLAVLTYRTLQEIRRQADTAQRQVEIMQRQLEATDRPWVKVASVSPIRDLEFHQLIVSSKTKTIDIFIGMRLVAENVGKSVALNAVVSARMLLSSNAISEPLVQASACSGRTDNASDDLPPIVVGPLNIFPSDTRQFDVQWKGTIDAKYIGSEIAPRFVGCVIYSMPNSERTRQSGFVYRIQYRPPNPDLPWESKPMIIGTEVKKDDLFVWPDPGSAVVGYAPFNSN